MTKLYSAQMMNEELLSLSPWLSLKGRNEQTAWNQTSIYRRDRFPYHYHLWAKRKKENTMCTQMINMKYEKRKEHYERRKHAGAGKHPNSPSQPF